MATTKTTARIGEKRAEILNVALTIFAREGFGNTDVQVIADLAGVGKGTVYRHFGNKEQLFLATAKFSLEQVATYVSRKIGGEEHIDAVFEQRGAAYLLTLIAQACAEYYRRHPQAVEIMIQERAQFRETVFPTHLMHREETRGGIDALIAKAVQSGEFGKVNVADATNAYADLLYGCVVNGCLEGNKSKLVKRVEAAVRIFVAGLKSDPAT